MARALAASGAAVAIQDIALDLAQREADAIVAECGRAIALGGDATDLSIAEKLVNDTLAQLGPIDILINNAGVQQGARFADVPVEDMIRQINCNMLLPFRLAQLTVPSMAERKWGRVINVSSIQARRGNGGMTIYAMTKAAIDNFTKGLMHAYRGTGITVNAIAPGWFVTHRNERDFPTPEEIENKGKWMPVGRVGYPDDCAGLTVLLCSQAGEYISGQVICVDGGMSA